MRQERMVAQTTAVEINAKNWSDSGYILKLELTRCPGPSTHVLIHYIHWIGILLSASSISSYIETRVFTFINSLIQLEMSFKYLL